MTEKLPLDPMPWTSVYIIERYATKVEALRFMNEELSAIHFAPRNGYSQSREDYND